MTTQITTQTISFYGSDLITLKVEDVIYTAVRPIVEALGLSWGSQSIKLNKNKEKFNCFDIETVGADGKIRQMLCMPSRNSTAGCSQSTLKKSERICVKK